VEQVIELMCLLAVAALAGNQLTETWHHGSLFEDWRDTAEQWSVSDNFFVSKLGELLMCPFCFSHWACALTFTVMLLAEPGSIGQWPVGVLATIRVATLVNDAAHNVTRMHSPQYDDEEIDIEVPDLSPEHLKQNDD
jgi:hypothetical protein